MKTIIMAGGYATRLWPITKTKAKPLLPVGTKKIVDIIYEKVSKFDSEILLSTNKRFEEDFRRWAKDKDVKVVVEDTMREEEKLGAVKALAQIAKDIDEDFLVVAGDNIFSFDIDPLIELFNEKRKPVTALYDVGDYELARRYGVAELDGWIVKRFYEKPEKPPSTLVGIAIYVFPQKVADILLNYVESSEMSDNLGDFLSHLCENMDVYGYAFTNGNWYDVGNPDSYIEAFKFYTDSHVDKSVEIGKAAKIIEPVVIEKNVVIKGRSIVGPYAYIGEGCEIESSDVSESVVFSKTIIKKVRLWRSIVDDACEIRNIELSSSIIGGHARIQRG
ncbi:MULTISPECIES: NDP-sugar synthase [unclassified Archaeoglobus]|jgi:glucose-1-phosphate thymidylyltransferase|uniref:NDP-sugar synthase n=1 Tax=unclassified Archaeoglobus TaxID=2643606 RepID=UPI0025BCA667|nr:MULTISPECIES: NDP-sugar synthase [unclassified Archaeoglobus]